MIIIDISFLTVNDIQEILKISKNTSYKLINTKGFPKIKIGNQIRIPKDRFEHWVSDNIGKTFII